MFTPKKIGKALAFLLLTILVRQLLCFLLVDDLKVYTRTMMHELYADAEKTETLFLGSSHCYRSVDPEIVDRMLNTTSFNAGSSAQMIDTSYYLLREALDCSDGIKTVYLETYYPFLEMNDGEGWANSYYIILDYMRWQSPNRYLLMLEEGGTIVPDTLFPAKRYFGNFLNNWSRYPAVWQAKLFNANDYEYPTSADEWYCGRGFVYSTKERSGEYAAAEDVEQGSPISDMGLNNLERIAALCAEKDVKLVLFASPLPSAYVQKINNYQAYVDAMRKFAGEHNTEYWDFSLYKDTEKLALTTQHFMDDDHLNGRGAELFTTVFCEVAAQSAQGRDVSSLFYDTAAEKLTFAPDGTLSGGQ